MTTLRQAKASSSPFSLVGGYGYFCGFADAVLLLPVTDGGADGVFCQDRAVNLDWGEGQLLDDVGVLDFKSFGDGLPLAPLGGQRRAGDCRAAAEGAELGF